MAKRTPDRPQAPDARPDGTDQPHEDGGPAWWSAEAGNRSEAAPPGGERQEEAAARGSPGAADVRSIIHNHTINIGVLASSIHDSTVTGTGHEAQASLFRASTHDGAIIWQVRPEVLARVGRIHVPAPTFERAAAILRRNHVLVLYGRAHWGKATMALRLLSHLHDDDVHVISPSPARSPSSLANPEILGAGGYLVDTLPRDVANGLNVSAVSRLSAHLRHADHGGHLIITVDGLTPLPTIDLADHLVSCEQPPDPEVVLGRHLDEQLSGADHAATLRLAKLEWCRERLRNQPPPPRVRDLALALRHAVRSQSVAEDTDTALAAVQREFQRRTQLFVNEWFEHHPATRERCFMLAVAALNGTSFEVITEATDRLRRLVYASLLMGEPTGPTEAATAWPLQSSRRRRVQDAGANLVPRPTSVAADGPDEVVELEEPLVQPFVLANVWHEHNDILGPMLDWVNELGHDARLEVSARAAAAAGQLCVGGLTFMRDRIVRPWATDRSVRRTARISAAIALRVAILEPSITDQVLRLLRQWTEPHAAVGLPWTAATAYGLLGTETGRNERFLTEALEGLRRVTSNYASMDWVVARSLANLCESGNAREALDALLAWTNDGSDELVARRALRVFDRLTRLQTTPAPDDEDPTLPVLLHLATQHQRSRLAVLRLWHHLLEERNQRTFDQVVTALHHWLELVDEDQRRQLALDTLLLPLLSKPRSRPRTRAALRRCAFDPDKRSRTALHYYRFERRLIPEAVVDALLAIGRRLR